MEAEITWHVGSIPLSVWETVVKIKAKALNNINAHLYLALESVFYLFQHDMSYSFWIYLKKNYIYNRHGEGILWKPS